MPGCMRCGNCCTRFRVLITPFDIVRLSEGMRLKPAGFADLIPEDKNRTREEPALAVGGTPMLLAIKKRAGGRCFFYSGDSCSAYAHRPLLCRAYPFVLRGGAVQDASSRACPVKWRPSKNEAKEYQEDAARYALEQKEFKKIAREWNSTRTGKFRELLCFLMKKAAAASSAGE